MLLKVSNFTYATYMDLVIGYQNIKLSNDASKLCTIITLFGKYKYHRLPMGGDKHRTWHLPRQDVPVVWRPWKCQDLHGWPTFCVTWNVWRSVRVHGWQRSWKVKIIGSLWLYQLLTLPPPPCPYPWGATCAVFWIHSLETPRPVLM